MDSYFSLKNSEISTLTRIEVDPKVRRSKFERQGGFEGLCNKLRTNLNNGLCSLDLNDLEKREEFYGKNELVKKVGKAFLGYVWMAMHDNLLIILMICALVSIFLPFLDQSEGCVCPGLLNNTITGNISLNTNQTDSYIPEEKQPEWLNGIAIFIAVAIVVFVTAFNNWQKEKQFRDLQKKLDSEHKINVLRDGTIKQIVSSDLLVGDISFLAYGNLVPADGIIIESNNLKVDEAVLTGESDLVKKNETDIFLSNSTQVMEGNAKFLVLAVGMNTQSGKIMAMLNVIEEENGNSPLQLKLEKLASQIGFIGIFMSIGTVALLFIRFFLTESNLNLELVLENTFDFIMIGITILVVAIPEGLPLAVTLSLAFAVKRMINDNNLVRHLEACETMGNATAICSDKTGTLTTNRMTVVQCYLNGKLYEKLPNPNEISSPLRHLLSNSISINSNYTSKLEHIQAPGQLAIQLGNRTECALLGFIEFLQEDYREIRKNNATKDLIYQYTFNSSRKSMTTCIAHPKIPNAIRLFCKGASEIIIAKSKFQFKNESATIITGTDRDNILFEINKMASKGLRTIAIAYKDFSPDPKEINEEMLPNLFDWENNENKIVNDLTLIAVCGIEDPVREEVPDAIQKCRDAGIVVRMITGDNVNTARKIASECGILNADENYLVLEGVDFDKKIKDVNGEVDQEKFDKIWPNLRVLARSSPENKYDLVKYMKNSKLNKTREVVAVTGDGTNDGPALKIADVGFAMGIQGTDIAKEASDIIITDDNFTSIVKAVMWGRNVFDSIGKFIQFQLSVNIVAVICEFVGASFGLKTFNSIQMLWINLIMDSLASLALATDEPTEDLLKRKPQGRTGSLISRTMIKNICFHTIYQFSVIIFLLLAGPKYINMNRSLNAESCPCLKNNYPTQHMTMVYNTFVIMMLFNQINSRKIHGEHNVFAGILQNNFFCSIWVLSFVVQILIVNYGKIGFMCLPLNLEQWAISILFGIGSLIWGQIVTFIPIEKLISKSEVKPEQQEISELKITNRKIGKVLWLRGISKIQKELKVVRAFRQAKMTR